MEKKKLVMVVYNPIEVDGRVKRTAQTLSNLFDITVVCVKGESVYQNDSYKIIRLKRRDRLGRTLRLLIFWLRIVCITMVKRPAVLYVHDFFLPFPGWIGAKLSGAKLVYDAHELIIPDKNGNLNSSEKLFYQLEKRTVNKCDLIIAANPERAIMMKEHYHLKKDPISVRNIPPPAKKKFSDEHIFKKYPLLKKRVNDIRIVYMGDINIERGLSVLIDAIYLLPVQYQLLFVGKGPDIDKIKNIASKDISGRIIVIGGVAHEEVHDVIRQADIGYLTYSMTGLNNIYCSPNKIFEYPQAGLPIISTCQPTTQQIFSKFRIGELVGCNHENVTAKTIADAITKIADNYNEYILMIEPFLEHYTWESQALILKESIGAIA